jgi:hypothetical protein
MLGSGGIAPPFSTSALDGHKWLASSPVCLPSVGAHWIADCVSPRASFGRCGEEKDPYLCREWNRSASAVREVA